MTTSADKPLKIFCSYAHKDEEYINDLRDSLRPLERQGLIEWWHDREITPGWGWEEDIDKNLRTADVILLLVSRAFMASDYVYEKEISVAVERHKRGEARVIPIIVRPADWEWASFGKLQALPKDANPITRWPDPDDAWLDVAKGVRRAIGELSRERQERVAKERYRNAVEDAWADKQMSDAEAEQLAALTRELRLSADVVADIERDIMGDTKEAILERQEHAAAEDAAKQRYREAVEEAWTNQKVSSEEAERLGDLAGELGLSTDTAANIEREVMGDTIEMILERQEEGAREEEPNRRLEELYAQARRLHRDRKWQAVIDVFEQLHTIDSGYPDREGLLASARESLEAQELARRVAAVYAEGRQHMDAAEWQQAFECFEEVQQLEPGYRDTERLLSRVRQVQSHRTEQAEASDQSRARMAGHPTSQAERAQPGEFAETRPRPMVPVGSGHWWALALRGAIAILFGLAVLLRQYIALETLILLFGAYALVDGVFSIVGVFGGTRDGTPHWRLLIGGVAGILAGVIAFLAPGLTALLLYLIAAWAIATGVFEIATAIRLRREIIGEWALIVGGAFSVLFGVILAVVGSAVGLISVTWLIGVYAVAFGIMLLIAAFLVWKQREVETAG